MNKDRTAVLANANAILAAVKLMLEKPKPNPDPDPDPDPKPNPDPNDEGEEENDGRHSDFDAQALEACRAMERYIAQARGEALGWMFAEACVSLGAGIDIRTINVHAMIERAVKELR